MIATTAKASGVVTGATRNYAAGLEGGAGSSYSSVYRGPAGLVPCSQAHHYAYRDHRTWDMTAVEFQQVYSVVPLDATDVAEATWFQEERQRMRKHEGEAAAVAGAAAAGCDEHRLCETPVGLAVAELFHMPQDACITVPLDNHVLGSQVVQCTHTRMGVVRQRAAATDAAATRRGRHIMKQLPHS